jgi:uncharacterized iron-regulated membrane protein
MATVDPLMPSGALYRAVWRWHFIAGLLVLPFLLLLGVTGGLYLFKPELEALAYPQLEYVTPRAATVPASRMVGGVEAATGGRVLQLTLPADARRSARMLVRMPAGHVRTAFSDPHDGRFLGSTDYGGVMQTVRKLHSLQLFGFWASALIEIAAGWAIVLVGTGFVLWWPRGRKGGVVSVRGGPAKRVFWRDVHAVTGAGAGLLIAFLAITGMPWSMVWGDYVHRWTTEAGLGEPAPPAETMPEWMLALDTAPGARSAHHQMTEAKPELPWAVARAAPVSRAPRGPGIGVDEAVRRARSKGLALPFSLSFPVGPKGAWVASYAPDKAEDVRTLYFDQFDGHLLGDVRYGDYGPAAKAISWGIAVHQGQQFGTVNRLIMLAGCIAIVMLAASSLVMWLKRRPAGGLGIPPAPDSRGVARGVLAIVMVVGIVFPLVGLSLIAALGWEVMLVTARRASGHFAR